MLRPFCPKFLCISLPLLLAPPATGLAARQRSPNLTLKSVNETEWQAQGKASTPLLAKLQALLDWEREKTGELEAPNQASRQLAAIQEPPLPERNPARNELAEQAPLAPSNMATIPWTEAEIAEAKALITSRFHPSRRDFAERLPPSC
jgi:hypothetical protein